MEFLLIEKDEFNIQQDMQVFNKVIKEKQVDFHVETTTEKFDTLSINKHYDAYFVKICKHCLKDSINFVYNQRRKDPNALFIFLSNLDYLIFETQIAHPFYFVRVGNIDEDLVNAIQLILDEIPKSNIIIKENGQSIIINTNDIYAVEIDDHYLNIYTSQKVYMIRDSLNRFTDAYGFLRIARNVSVNPKYIVEKNKTSILLSNDLKFKCSAKYYRNN